MTKIHHAHLYGLREHKYQVLKENSINTTDFTEVHPQEPFYLFIPQNTDLLGEYNQYFKITDIMPVNSVGIVTARDKLTIQNSSEEIWKTVNDFVNLDVESAREKYDLGKDSQDWKVNLAQEDIKNSGLTKDKIIPILYRPFDVKFTYYTGNSGGLICRPRPEVMKNMLLGDNLGLITVRKSPPMNYFNYFMVTNNIISNGVIRSDNQSIDSLFPLYLYPDPNNPKELQQKKRPNFSDKFLKTIQTKLEYLPPPEEIFYYIYAVFHSPTYRTRYAEFLKIDFPRVPITKNQELFRKLAEIGEELVQLHLMTSPVLDNLITEFISKGDNIVASGHPKYANNTVLINKKGEGFKGVSEEIWNFYIGGYQVCQKWLKDRKDRKLSDEDIIHYQKIVLVLGETIKLMQLIDEVIPGFPIE